MENLSLVIGMRAIAAGSGWVCTAGWHWSGALAACGFRGKAVR